MRKLLTALSVSLLLATGGALAQTGEVTVTQGVNPGEVIVKQAGQPDVTLTNATVNNGVVTGVNAAGQTVTISGAGISAATGVAGLAGLAGVEVVGIAVAVGAAASIASGGGGGAGTIGTTGTTN